MKEYVVTFYTHYDAVSYYRELKKSGIESKLMPVPRKLSSSCGTCVAFASESYPVTFDGIEIEGVFKK